MIFKNTARVILNKSIWGRLWSFDADPCVIKKNKKYYLYSHNLFGIREHVSDDGIHFTFIRYVVFAGYRPFVQKNILYYEKMTDRIKFPFYTSHLRKRHLITGKDTLVYNTTRNTACPSIVDGYIFFSTGLRMMDYNMPEPCQLQALGVPKITGLTNITGLRKCRDTYLGTQVGNHRGKSFAKIVECHPIHFPDKWKIGKDILTADMLNPGISLVYVASQAGNKLYFNVRYGRKAYSSEKILMLEVDLKKKITASQDATRRRLHHP